MLPLLILLIGCEPKITSGEVIDKEFVPEHWETHYVTQVRFIGKTAYTTVVPMLYHYPDKWTITIVGYDSNGERVTETFRVSENVYDTVSIGDEFVYDKEMEPDSPEYTREPVE